MLQTQSPSLRAAQEADSAQKLHRLHKKVQPEGALSRNCFCSPVVLACGNAAVLEAVAHSTSSPPLQGAVAVEGDSPAKQRRAGLDDKPKKKKKVGWELPASQQGRLAWLTRGVRCCIFTQCRPAWRLLSDAGTPISLCLTRPQRKLRRESAAEWELPSAGQRARRADPLEPYRQQLWVAGHLNLDLPGVCVLVAGHANAVEGLAVCSPSFALCPLLLQEGVFDGAAPQHGKRLT